MVEVDDSLPSNVRIQTLDEVVYSQVAQHSTTVVDSQSLVFETQQVVQDDQYILFTLATTDSDDMPFLRTRKLRADTLFRS
jgi:hypothetical protein